MTFGAFPSLPRAPTKVRSQTELPTLGVARQPVLGQGLRVIAASRRSPDVTARQFGDLPNMI
jgi:hypothetical protein